MSDLDQLDEEPAPGPVRPLSPRVRMLVAGAAALLVAATLTVVLTGNEPPDTVSALGVEPIAAGDRLPTEAASRLGWPLIANDEFTGPDLNLAKWDLYAGRSTGGVGQHDPANISVSAGTLKIVSRGDSTGGMNMDGGRQFGRWEVRAKAQRGAGYSQVILLWPDSEVFPDDGEIDFMEIPNPAKDESHFVLHSGPRNLQAATSVRGDFTQWHTYAVEWTDEEIIGFIDGEQIFRTTDRAGFPPGPMHLAIQQDPGPFGDGWVPPRDETTPAEVTLEVDWVRVYGV